MHPTSPDHVLDGVGEGGKILERDIFGSGIKSTPDVRSSSPISSGVSPGIFLRLLLRVFRLCPNAALIV